MKKLLPILLLLLSCHVIAQNTIDEKLAYSEKVEVKYDKFDDKTQVRLMLQISGRPMPLRGLSMFVLDSFQGQNPKSSITPAIIVTAISELPSYQDSYSLIFMADDVRIPLVNGLYTVKIRTLSNEVNAVESVVYLPTSEQWKQLASAKKIEAKFGRTILELKPNQIEALKDYYDRFIVSK